MVLQISELDLSCHRIKDIGLSVSVAEYFHSWSRVWSTCSQCLSFIPRLQAIDSTGRCCLNLSSLYFMDSAMRLGTGTSGKLLLSLYMVLHIFPTSSLISSAFSCWRGPEYNSIKKAQQAHQRKGDYQGGLITAIFNHRPLIENQLCYKKWS